MPDIRLVALDLDGTVFNDEKEITPARWRPSALPLPKGLMSSPQRGVWHRVCRKRFCAFPACGMP